MTIKATVTQKDGTVRSLVFMSIEEYTDWLIRRWHLIEESDAKVVRPVEIRQGRDE